MGIIGSRTSEERENMLESRHESSYKRTTCILDDQILNRYTIHHMTNLGLSIFADVCGRNRGVFVVEPNDQQREPTSTAANGDGATYSCLTLPPSFANGLPESVPMATSNDIGTFCLHTKQERESTRGDAGSK
jgi:hypothetical protein